MNLRFQFAQTVHELAHIDKNIVVVVGDISHGIFKPFAKDYPSRYYNIGICEPAMVSLGAGLSKVGLNPVLHTIAPFLIERSFEQLKLDFEYQNQNVNLVSVGGTFDYSQLGCSHHCYSDVTMLRQLPSSQIFLPGSAEEFDYLFKKNYRLPGIKYYRLTENPHGIPVALDKLTKSGVSIRNGNDLTMVTTGAQLKTCSKACDFLQDAGIAVDLIYLPQVWPFDPSLLRLSCQKTSSLFVVSELHENGGLFDQCLKNCADLKLDFFHGMEISDFVREYGSYTDLCKKVGLVPEVIYEEVLKRKSILSSVK